MADDGPLGLTADEVLTTTRAVRKRLDYERPVARSLIEECVRIATQAPSGRNTQRWDFVFVDGPDVKARIAAIWNRGLRTPVEQPGWSPHATRVAADPHAWAKIADSLDHLAQRLHEAPLIWIPCLRVSDRAELDSVRGQAGAWGSAIPAVWSFMLAAHERGLGTAWTTCHLAYEREMADLLGLDFSTTVQVALSPVAHTIGTHFKPATRADHRDFMHWNRW